MRSCLPLCALSTCNLFNQWIECCLYQWATRKVSFTTLVTFETVTVEIIYSFWETVFRYKIPNDWKLLALQISTSLLNIIVIIQVILMFCLLLWEELSGTACCHAHYNRLSAHCICSVFYLTILSVGTTTQCQWETNDWVWKHWFKYTDREKTKHS